MSEGHRQPWGDDVLDLAVIGAGAAGTYVAHAVQAARPDWSIALFERSGRIGGRLRSVAVPGVEQRIELGGMRFHTDHRHVQEVVTALGIPTHAFDATGGPDRSYFRGRFGAGFDDPGAGDGYDLAADERGRSAADLVARAFDRIVPGFADLDAGGWLRTRATATYLGRRLIDWSIGDALATVLTEGGRQFLTDALGYDSGPRAQSAGDAIEYFSGGGDPNAEARTPDDGMDHIPRALAARFEDAGGVIRTNAELQGLAIDGGLVHLRFGGGRGVTARRVVLTMPIPALRRVAAASRPLGGAAFARVLAAVEGFPAVKLYLWYDRPWWRESVSGHRTVTDLPIRKVFYFDERPDGPAVLLGAFADGRDTGFWLDLSGGVSDGAPAPPPVLAAVAASLLELHPAVDAIPTPTGSAFMHWGSDPLEAAWTFWRPGHVSDEIMAVAPQPDPRLPIYVAGETFSRAQAWVEGALETADEVVRRLLAGSDQA